LSVVRDPGPSVAAPEQGLFPKLRVGVFGAGRLGTRHARYIASTGSKIVVVCDANLDTAKHLADLVGASVATTSMEKFFDQKLDAVVIATPPSMRAPAILASCDRGAHIFVEKPSVLNLEDGRNCQKYIDKAGILVSVGFQFRYAPVFEMMKELLSDQPIHLLRSLGTESYYVTFYQPMWKLNKKISGGVVGEQASHLLDLARFLLRNAKGIRASAIGEKTMAFDRSDCDIENGVQILYELEDKRFGTHAIHCGTVGYSIEMEVIGPHLRMRNFGAYELVGYRDEKPFRQTCPRVNSIGVGKVGAWLRAIKTDDSSFIRSPFDDSLYTVAICEAAQKSLDSQGFVKVRAP
jgi:predicted dehydrogenase